MRLDLARPDSVRPAHFGRFACFVLAAALGQSAAAPAVVGAAGASMAL